MKHKPLSSEFHESSFSLSDCNIDELVGNLENLPTKKFKAEMKDSKSMKSEQGNGTKLQNKSLAIAEDVALEVKVVKKTFTLHKESLKIVDSALERALTVLPFSNQNLEEALLEICRVYETTRMGASSIEDLSDPTLSDAGALAHSAKNSADVVTSEAPI